MRVFSKPPNLHLSTVGMPGGLERVGVIQSAGAIITGGPSHRSPIGGPPTSVSWTLRVPEQARASYRRRPVKPQKPKQGRDPETYYEQGIWL